MVHRNKEFTGYIAQVGGKCKFCFFFEYLWALKIAQENTFIIGRTLMHRKRICMQWTPYWATLNIFNYMLCFRKHV